MLTTAEFTRFRRIFYFSPTLAYQTIHFMLSRQKENQSSLESVIDNEKVINAYHFIIGDTDITIEGVRLVPTKAGYRIDNS